MAASDEPQVAPWCAACRRSSSGKWTRHAFSAGHQAAALRFLRARAAELERMAADFGGDGAADPSGKWRCRLCEGEDGVKVAGRRWSEGVEHFASDEHRRAVERFCRRMRCDHERKTRHLLWFEPERSSELLKKRKETRRKAETEATRAETDASRAWKAEAFLESATARLQEVQAQRAAAGKDADDINPSSPAGGFGPPAATGALRVKTVESRAGILQNPLGRHNGERVWGGGIVKIKNSNWVAWGIDTLVREEQARRAHGSLDASGNENPTYSHRMTEMAFGEGLGSIARVDWALNVGNVHTGAVPPWLVGTEDEYKTQNHLQSQAPVAASVDKRKILRQVKTQKSHDPNWLPNFGGVWESGPRSITKQSFQKAARTRRKREAPQPFDQPQQSMPTLRQPPLPPLPRPPLPYSPSTATKSQSDDFCSLVDAGHTSTAVEPTQDIYSAAVDEKPSSTLAPLCPPPASPPLPAPPAEPSSAAPTTALDAKREQLLAQKERLRAKFAARRKR